MIDTAFPSRAVVQKSTFADGGLDFFLWRGQWLDRALLGAKLCEAILGALPVGLQKIEPA